MKNTLLAAILLLAPFVRAEEDVRRFEVVHCGSDAVVEFDGTQSPDGKFAFGWTIRPDSKSTPSVDWARAEKEGDEIIYKYQGDHTDWQLLNGVINLQRKSFTPFPASDPIGPKENRHTIHVFWVDAQHALVLINRRFDTVDAFYLSTADDAVEAKNLLRNMNEKVEELVCEKRPLSPKQCIYYFNESSVLERKIEKGIFCVKFGACIPKASYEDIDGKILISIKEGKLLKAVSDDLSDRPFIGELGDADNRLNETYGKLRKSLSGDAIQHLVADQKQWIITRNQEARSFADDKAPIFGESTLDGYREARNQQALKLTRERTAVLQKQLDAIGSK